MIRAYLKYQSKIIFSMVLASLLFSMFEYLFHADLEDIVYSVFLYLFIMFLFLMYDYYHFLKKYKKLNNLQGNLSIYAQDVPKAENPVEEKYNEILQRLYEVIEGTINRFDNQTTENEEYYTLWIHQIKTPIAAMHFVLQNMEDIPQKAVLELELFKIEQYVELTLQFIKIGNIESDLVINQYPLKDMVNRSIRKYSLLFIHKGLGVSVTGCEETITTDSKWFTFLLEQILSNAVKYTNAGAIQIYTRQDEKGTYLTIEDTGIGIKKEDIKRVFEKGYTGFNGRMDNKASGIGLYLAKKVAAALNHKMTIESVVGKGTKVHIFIRHYS